VKFAIGDKIRSTRNPDVIALVTGFNEKDNRYRIKYLTTGGGNELYADWTESHYELFHNGITLFMECL
jgi:hypothetical protein